MASFMCSVRSVPKSTEGGEVHFWVIWRALVREMSMVWELRWKLPGHLHAWQCSWVLSGLFCLAWAALVSVCYGQWRHQFPKSSALHGCPLYPGIRVFSITSFHTLPVSARLQMLCGCIRVNTCTNKGISNSSNWIVQELSGSLII